MLIRRSNERGHARQDWLTSWHTFSFADYYDPQYMGFGNIRVINEDIVAPNSGFGTHPHRDMEIITYMLSGELKHEDSMGNGAIIHPDEIQVMSAGTGIRHSEINPSENTSAHLLQIWIVPDTKGVKPRWEQKIFARETKMNQLRLLVSKDGRDGSLMIHQNTDLYASVLEPGKDLLLPSSKNPFFIHVVAGDLKVGDTKLLSGDAIMGDSFGEFRVQTSGGAEILVFL
ncbi:MAG: pirin family protein [Candidatus Cloacimonetes bacterium]|nr:pirin family protein [Candidatus Cloacimonadota bacterium]